MKQKKIKTYKEADFEKYKDITKMWCETDIPQIGIGEAEEALEREAEEAISYHEKECGLKMSKKMRETYKHFLVVKLLKYLEDEITYFYKHDGEVFEIND